MDVPRNAYANNRSVAFVGTFRNDNSVWIVRFVERVAWLCYLKELQDVQDEER